MSNRTRYICYTLYILAITGLFFYLRFPGEAVRDFVENKASRLYPGLTVDIAAAGLRPFFWVNFEDCRLDYQSRPLLRCDYLKLRPSWRALGGQPAGAFEAAVLGGRIDGRGRQKGRADFSGRARFEDIQLARIDETWLLPGYELSGRAQGELSFAVTAGQPRATSEVQVNQVELVFPEPFLGLTKMTFDRIEAQLTANETALEIKDCQLQGAQLDGTLSGRIVIRRPYEKSVLNVDGFLKPHSDFIARLGQSFPMDLLARGGSGEQGIPIRLTGTLANPGVSLR